MVGLFVLMLACGQIAAAPAGRVILDGELAFSDQLSGAAVHGKLLVLCPDEGARINVLKRLSDTRFAALESIALVDDDGAEIDMEGVASDGNAVYVVGSHSRARKQVEPDAPHARNQQRLREIKDEESRYHLFRMELDENGELVKLDSISLGKLLKQDDILGLFTQLPSKENGVDIEGLAVSAGRLFVGFRGPVLRGNHVPVLVLRYAAHQQYELLFLDLGGRGIRDLAAIDNGMLVLAGPVGDGDGSYELFHWNGKDCVAGEGSPGGKTIHLGTIGGTAHAKPEGIAVLEQTAADVKLLVIRDGAREQVADVLQVTLPR